MAVNTLIQLRRGSTTQWNSAAAQIGQGILYNGELGLDTTLKMIKVGNGENTYSDLPYATIPTTWTDVVITDSFTENVHNIVADLLEEGNKIDLVYNDNTGKLIINLEQLSIFDLVNMVASDENLNKLAGVTPGTVTAPVAAGSGFTGTTGGALVVDANKDLSGIRNLTIENLFVTGNTTRIDSTIVTIDDPVFTLGGDTAPTVDDGNDRGIEFRYYKDNAAKVGFFGWNNGSQEFVFLKDATNNTESFTGTKGKIDVLLGGDNVVISDATNENTLATADTFLFHDASVTANKSVTGTNLRGFVYGGVSGDVTIDSSGVVSIANDSVDLTTHTTGNYVASVGTAANTGLGGGAAGSEGAAIALSLDINNLTTSSDNLHVTNDLFAIYDGSAAGTRKVTTTIVRQGVYAGISGDVSINSSGVATVSGAGNVTVAAEVTDTDNYLVFVTNNTGSLAPKVNNNIRFNAAAGSSALIGAPVSTTSPVTKLEYFIIDGGTP